MYGSYNNPDAVTYLDYVVKEPRESVAPVVEPVTLDEAKNHLRVDYSEDDALIMNMVAAIRRYMERKLNIAMVERTYTANLPRFFERVHFPHQPLVSVPTIQYYNAESPSVLTTLADSTSSPQVASTTYRVNTEEGYIYRINGATLPDTACRHDAVQITFVCGHSGSPAQSSVPDDLRAALLLGLGDLYENRESSTPLKVEQLPTMKRLMMGHRIYQ
jgi:uncharacterized phiE125 gp8 family phage protein